MLPNNAADEISTESVSVTSSTRLRFRHQNRDSILLLETALQNERVFRPLEDVWGRFFSSNSRSRSRSRPLSRQDSHAPDQSRDVAHSRTFLGGRENAGEQRIAGDEGIAFSSSGSDEAGASGAETSSSDDPARNRLHRPSEQETGKRISWSENLENIAPAEYRRDVDRGATSETQQKPESSAQPTFSEWVSNKTGLHLFSNGAAAKDAALPLLGRAQEDPVSVKDMSTIGSLAEVVVLNDAARPGISKVSSTPNSVTNAFSAKAWLSSLGFFVYIYGLFLRVSLPTVVSGMLLYLPELVNVHAVSNFYTVLGKNRQKVLRKVGYNRGSPYSQDTDDESSANSNANEEFIQSLMEDLGGSSFDPISPRETTSEWQSLHQANLDIASYEDLVQKNGEKITPAIAEVEKTVQARLGLEEKAHQKIESRAEYHQRILDNLRKYRDGLYNQYYESKISALKDEVRVNRIQKLKEFHVSSVFFRQMILLSSHIKEVVRSCPHRGK